MAKGSKPTQVQIPNSEVTAQGIQRVFSDDYIPETKSDLTLKQEKTDDDEEENGFDNSMDDNMSPDDVGCDEMSDQQLIKDESQAPQPDIKGKIINFSRHFIHLLFENGYCKETLVDDDDERRTSWTHRTMTVTLKYISDFF